VTSELKLAFDEPPAKSLCRQREWFVIDMFMSSARLFGVGSLWQANSGH